VKNCPAPPLLGIDSIVGGEVIRVIVMDLDNPSVILEVNNLKDNMNSSRHARKYLNMLGN
jgi:hypothetical protein